MNERHWYLQCFGCFKALRGSNTLERFKTQKTAALLALLALRGSQNRETICALLWPDNAPEAARNSLSAALSSLRRDLGPETLQASRQRVALTVGQVRTDVADFDRALKNGDWASAVALYQGNLLPNFHEDPFPALAGEYQEKGRGAFHQRLNELESGSNPDELRKVARRASLLFGEDERWLLGLMRGQQMAGDVDAALRVYEALGRHARKNGDVVSEAARALAKVLRRERERLQSLSGAVPVDLGPSEEVEEKPEITPAVSTASHLPLAWTRFFGREAERDLLGNWLCWRERGALLITLTGAGGSGKTRLAIETLRAANLSEEGCENSKAVFVPLAALSDPDLLFNAVRDAVGLPALPGLAPLEQLRRALQGKKALFLLDNFEQLMPAGAEKLQQLRMTLPDAAFLVTSRVLLNLPGEREFAVAPLPTPLPNSSKTDALRSPSVAMFCDRAGLELDDENTSAIGALCRRLDGIPLAIELAAARAKMLSPAQIVERLASHPNFLQSREFGLPARHQTLRATIEWSTALLPEELRRFFCRLSVFRGGWTLEAAEQVCDSLDALDYLTALRESSLLRVETGADGTRFRMLQTLREFGLEQLGAERAEVEEAFFEFYFDLAAEAAGAMQGPRQTMWLGRLDAEQDNMRAALEWARDHDAARGLQLATSLIDFWETRLSLDEGRHWIETFLKATEKAADLPVTPAGPNARALSGAGRLAWYANDLNSSRLLLEQGLEAAREEGDGKAAVYALHSSARLAAIAGDNARAAELGRESVRLSRGAGDQRLLMASLLDLAPSHVLAARFRELAATCDEAIELARGLGDDHALALGLYLRAIADFYEGSFAATLPRLEESERLCRALGARWDLMVCLGVAGSSWRELGDFSRGGAALFEAVGLARELGLESLVVVNILLATSYLLVRREDLAPGVKLMGACESFARKIDYSLPANLREEWAYFRAIAVAGLEKTAFARAWEEGVALEPAAAVDFVLQLPAIAADNALMATRARAMSGVGRLAFYGSDALRETAMLERGMEAARQSGDPAAIVYASRTLARVAALGGDVDRARLLGGEGVQVSRAANDDALLMESLLDLAFANFNDGQLEASRRNCEEALELARKMGDEHGQALATVTLACVEGRDENYRTALQLIEESEPICRRLGAPWELMVCLANRGDILSRQGRFELAQVNFVESLQIARQHYLNSWNVVTSTLAVGFHFCRAGDFEAAARVFGACHALGAALNYDLMPILKPDLALFTAQARAALGTERFEMEYESGQKLSPDELIAFSSERKIAVFTDADLSTRARALSGAGRLAWYASEESRASDLLERGLEAARQVNDRAAIIYATRTLARVAANSDDPQHAVELGEESVRLAHHVGDKSLLIESLMDLAYVSFNIGDFEAASRSASEALDLATEIEDHGSSAYAILVLAGVSDVQGQFEQALEYLDRSENVSRLLGTRWDLTTCNAMRGQVFSKMGNFPASQACYVKALILLLETVPGTWHGATTLFSVCWAWMRRNDPVYTRYAAQLMGGAEALRQSINYTMMPSLAGYQEQYALEAKAKLGEAAFEAAWKRGLAMGTEETMRFAIDPEAAPDAEREQVALRSRALSGAGRLAWHHSDFTSSRELVEQGLDAARRSGDLSSFVQAVAAWVRFSASTGDVAGDIARGRALAEEAVARCRAVADKALLLESLISLVYAATMAHQLEGMRAFYREAVALARELGDEIRLATVLISFSTFAYYEGNYAEARAYLDECIPLCRRQGVPFSLFAALWSLTNCARESGDWDEARAAAVEALQLNFGDDGLKSNVVNGLLTGAYLLIATGRPSRGVQVMSAAFAMAQSIGYGLVPSLRPDAGRYEDLGREKLGLAAFAAAWERGLSTTTEAAIELVTEAAPVEPTAGPRPSSEGELLATRSRALSGAGQLAWHDSDLEASRSLVHQGLETARLAGDLTSFVQAVGAFVRFAMVTGDVDGYMAEARRLGEEAVRRSEQAGDEALLLDALVSLGYAHTIVSNFRESREVNRRAVALARRTGDSINRARALNNLASVEYFDGRLAAARAVLDESLALCHEIGSVWELIVVLWTQSYILLAEGDLDAAQASVLQVLELCRQNPAFRWGLSNVLSAASYIRVERGQLEIAVQIMGSTQAMEQETGFQMVPVLRPEFERYRDKARRLLGQQAFDAAWARGRQLSVDEAFELGLGE